MIRIQVDPKLQSVVNLFKEAYWWFTCIGINPMADHAAKAVIRRAELRNPSRPKARL